MVSDKSLFLGFRSLRWLGKPYSSREELSWWQSVCSVAIVVVIGVYSVLFIFGVTHEHKNIASAVIIFSIVGNNFLASNLLLLNLRKNHPLCAVVKTLRSLPFSLPANNHVGWMFIGLCLVATNLCIDLFVYPVYHLITQIPVFYFSDILIYLFLAQFVVPLLMIWDQLFNLSLSLDCLRKREDPALLSETIQLLEVHRELIKLSSQLNEIFSFPLVVILGAKLFGVTGSMYYLTCSYFDLLDNSIRVRSYSHLFGAINDLYQIWCIIHTTWLITDKVRKVNGDFYSLCLNETSQSLIENELLTSFLEQRVTLAFTAHGLFLLDHSLFKSILATTATYLFIIIQFQIRSNLRDERAMNKSEIV